MKNFFVKLLVLCTLSFLSIKSAAAQVFQDIHIETAWNGNISAVGAAKSDFYAQSFIADNMKTIKRFGVLIAENIPEGEVILAIAPDNGSGKPDVFHPIYQGSLINPTPTFTWYYEDANVPVTAGQKYWIVIDGYNNPGTTGNSRIGTSNSYTNTYENMIFTNYGGFLFEQIGSPLAVYLVAEPLLPIPALSDYMLWLLGIGLAGIGVFIIKRSAGRPTHSQV